MTENGPVVAIDSVRLVYMDHDLIASFDADADLLFQAIERLEWGQWVLMRSDPVAPRAPAGVIRSASVVGDIGHGYVTVRPFDTGDFGPLPIAEAPTWGDWTDWALRIVMGRERAEAEFVRRVRR